MADKYIEEAIKEIKENWFANHTAEVEGTETTQVIYWRKNNTRNYFTKYILSGSDLIVTGDIGSAVFTLSCKATLDNIKDFNLSYLMGKLSARSEERWDFDEKKARIDLKEWYDEIISDGVDDEEEFQRLYEDLVNATGQWSLQSHFQTAVFSIYEHSKVDWFDGETASMISDFGKRLPYRFIAYWVGLQMAIEQLEKKTQTA